LNNLLTARQASERLHIHLNTLYKWIEKGILPAHRIGILKWYIKAEDVQALLNGRGVGQNTGNTNKNKCDCPGLVADPTPRSR